MQQRPLRPNHYRVTWGAVFEAGIQALQSDSPYIVEILDHLCWALERDPEARGELCPAYPGRDIRLMLTPHTVRYPSLRVLFEITDHKVYMWHVCKAGAP